MRNRYQPKCHKVIRLKLNVKKSGAMNLFRKVSSIVVAYVTTKLQQKVI